ncbi:MAG: hypothetical protein ABI861_11385 [Panacibacter sp.]
MKISKNINRLTLHDSHFEKEIREQNNIEVLFDWAKLDNFIEGDINEFIVLGKTTLRLNGISNEELRIFYDDHKFKVIAFPENIGQYWNQISYTTINDTEKYLLLDGLYDYEGKKCWAEWSLNYVSCEVEWDSFVTFNEWQNGSLPSI